MKHAHIIPLAGGSVIGTELAFKRKPEWIASWEVFAKNDQWCKQYYPNIPFYLLDNMSQAKINSLPKVDLLTCVPPCSGLSNATTGTRGCEAPQNEHMIKVAKFGMKRKTPCIIIENAPMLYSSGGYPFLARFFPLIEKYKYSMKLLKTSTILHGLPQNRVRTFVILYEGDSQPNLQWIEKPYTPLVDWKPEDGERVWPGKGSEDELVNLLYKHYGSRKNLYDTLDGPRTSFVMAQVLGYGGTKFKTERYEKLFRRAERKAVLDVTPTFVKNYTNALMWKVTTYMLHPTQNRFISIRELMSMMGLPKDYPQIPKQFMNHIFQNVPVTTVKTLVESITQSLNSKDWRKVPFMRVNNIHKKIDSIGYTYKSLYI